MLHGHVGPHARPIALQTGKGICIMVAQSEVEAEIFGPSGARILLQSLGGGPLIDYFPHLLII